MDAMDVIAKGQCIVCVKVMLKWAQKFNGNSDILKTSKYVDHYNDSEAFFAFSPPFNV
jgi:hypothetical protein